MTSDLPVASVEGCRYDGIAKRDHGQRWTAEAGWHPWVEPTHEQVHERARAKREVAAVDRYWAALDRGLSDHEAREEGWPAR